MTREVKIEVIVDVGEEGGIGAVVTDGAANCGGYPGSVSSHSNAVLPVIIQVDKRTQQDM